MSQEIYWYDSYFTVWSSTVHRGVDPFLGWGGGGKSKKNIKIFGPLCTQTCNIKILHAKRAAKLKIMLNLMVLLCLAMLFKTFLHYIF